MPTLQLMTPDDLIRRCRRLIGDSPIESSGEMDVGYFFQSFRPDGHGLAEVFEGVPHGDQILSRLEEVYAVAGHTLEDMYFVVRAPQQAEKSDALLWAKGHFENMWKLAREAKDEELAQMLGKPPMVSVSVGTAPPLPRHPRVLSDLECLLYDRIGDFVCRLEPKDDLALTLREAFYLIACDYQLSRYLLWPVYAECVKVADPFSCYFQLWSHGIELRYPTNTQVVAYIPAPRILDR